MKTFTSSLSLSGGAAPCRSAELTVPSMLGVVGAVEEILSFVEGVDLEALGRARIDVGTRKELFAGGLIGVVEDHEVVYQVSSFVISAGVGSPAVTSIVSVSKASP